MPSKFAEAIISLHKEEQMAKRSATVKAPTMEAGEAKRQPLAIVLYTVPGWGKSTTASNATEPGLVMGRDETGYETLLGQGLVPNIPRTTVRDWGSYLALLDTLAEGCDYKVLAIDTLGAIEQLCHEHVCNREFRGQWGESGFAGYNRGPKVASQDWGQMLQKLGRIKANGTSILLLGHVRITKSRDPLSEEYDKATLDIDQKYSLPAVRRWSDAILYGTFETQVEEDGLRKKGKGGRDRVLYCENAAAHIAKNRLGLPEMLKVPDDPSQNWAVIRNAIKEGARNAE